MMKRIVLSALALMIPSVVFAGDFSDGVYHSNLGYSVKVPSGWTRVDASTVEAIREKLPENIDPDSTSRFDVIFFPQYIDKDLTLDADRDGGDPKKIINKVKRPEFSPTMSIMVVDYKVSNLLSDDVLKAYGDAFVKSVSDMSFVKEFKVSSKGKESFKGGDAFFYQYEFKTGSREIAVQQAVMGVKENAYIVTCTFEGNDFSKNKSLCNTLINSIETK